MYAGPTRDRNRHNAELNPFRKFCVSIDGLRPSRCYDDGVYGEWLSEAALRNLPPAVAHIQIYLRDSELVQQKKSELSEVYVTV